MTYTDLLALVSNYAVQDQPTPEFTAALPTFVSNAELRIYRDLSPLAASGQNRSLATVAGNREVDLNPMTGTTINGAAVQFQYPIIVEDVAALVGGKWVAFLPTSLAWIEMVWPSETATLPPSQGLAYFTMFDPWSLVLAPTPDAAYPLRITGVWRPQMMSEFNPVTWLAETHPDLLLCAAMVEAAGWMRNFGQQSDDPQMAMSWSKRYAEALASAQPEEALRQGQEAGWQAQAQVPLAGAPRT